jgi:hypothetical protein
MLKTVRCSVVKELSGCQFIEAERKELKKIISPLKIHPQVIYASRLLKLPALPALRTDLARSANSDFAFYCVLCLIISNIILIQFCMLAYIYTGGMGRNPETQNPENYTSHLLRPALFWECDVVSGY